MAAMLVFWQTGVFKTLVSQNDCDSLVNEGRLQFTSQNSDQNANGMAIFSRQTGKFPKYTWNIHSWKVYVVQNFQPK